jgi:hypothetical protein
MSDEWGVQARRAFFTRRILGGSTFRPPCSDYPPDQKGWKRQSRRSNVSDLLATDQTAYYFVQFHKGIA